MIGMFVICGFPDRELAKSKLEVLLVDEIAATVGCKELRGKTTLSSVNWLKWHCMIQGEQLS